MGPIRDTQGVEQGGCTSDKVYKLVNNEQLKTAQESELGVDLGLSVLPNGEIVRQVLSCAGFADDVSLLTDSVEKLKALLYLTKCYCEKFQVKLVPAKTMLLVFTTKGTTMKAKVELASHRLCIDNAEISTSNQATHVGIVRSPEGNGPNILARLSAHRRAV